MNEETGWQRLERHFDEMMARVTAAESQLADARVRLAQLHEANEYLKSGEDERRADYDDLRAELADLQATFDLRHRADTRAIERWRAGHPERALMLPDQADLCVWLLERLEESGAQLAEATARVVVLEGALAIPCYECGPVDCSKCKQRQAALANPNPLAAAFGRVVGASVKVRSLEIDAMPDYDPSTYDGLLREAKLERSDAVDALRALAPGWPS